MLRRLLLRDVAIVDALELDFDAGFTVLTGETGAGKSILIDALQLALGARADTALVREHAERAEVAAEFDCPEALRSWLDDGGFPAPEDGRLLLRRVVDAQGRSRAWVNGGAATMAQLREAAEGLLDIHGQHAWQSLTRPAAVRDWLDGQAGVDGQALAAAWTAWRERQDALERATARREALDLERDRLAWQIREVDELAPAEHEWEELNAEHQRLAHGQALVDAGRQALAALSEDEAAAGSQVARAAAALDAVVRYDATLAAPLEVLQAVQAQVDDVAHTLASYLGQAEPDEHRLAELDQRLSQWLALARRHRRSPAELPAMLSGWKAELAALDASADLERLRRAADEARETWLQQARQVSRQRHAAAPELAAAVSSTMQTLGMAGGSFQITLPTLDEPASWGLETVELRVAGHAGSTPRPLAKVASGGELSRLALAIAVSTLGGSSASTPATLIFDEIDAGVGGAVADAVGRLMKKLGSQVQVLAVTHLAQVAACADHHLVVSKAERGGLTLSEVRTVNGEARVGEVARMLGGERLGGETSRAHAQAMLGERRA